jgi:hypothetical protein
MTEVRTDRLSYWFSGRIVYFPKSYIAAAPPKVSTFDEAAPG